MQTIARFATRGRERHLWKVQKRSSVEERKRDEEPFIRDREHARREKRNPSPFDARGTTGRADQSRIRTLVSLVLIDKREARLSRWVRQWDRQIGHQSIVSIRASYHGVNTMGQSSSRYTHRCLRLFVRSMARRAYYAEWNTVLWQK